MSELARLYVQIALLQRGPQDLPASTLLLVITALGYFVVNSLIFLLLPEPRGPWLPVLLLEIPFTLAWYALLMRVVRKPERTLQTTSAMLGYRTVLSPLSIVAGWLALRYGSDSSWQLPLGVGSVIIVVWLIAASSHVLRAALEWPLPYCTALAIAEIAAESLAVIAVVPQGLSTAA